MAPIITACVCSNSCCLPYIRSHVSSFFSKTIASEYIARIGADSMGAIVPMTKKAWGRYLQVHRNFVMTFLKQ